MRVYPLVEQLRFTRSEFQRAIKTVDQVGAQKRFLPMNSISWNVGHLAWQEQRYFVTYPTGATPYPEIARSFAVGAPGSTPELETVLTAWREITSAADEWLNQATSKELASRVLSRGREISYIYGNLVQRVIYHYWYHLGENLAIRQLLGERNLPQFVGNLDERAPFRA